MIWIKERARSSSTCFRKRPDNRHSRRMLKRGKWCNTQVCGLPVRPWLRAGPSPSVRQACRSKLSVQSKNWKTHIAFNSKNLRKKSRSATGGCILSRTLYHTAYISKEDPKNNQTCTCTSGQVPSKKHHQKCTVMYSNLQFCRSSSLKIVCGVEICSK